MSDEQVNVPQDLTLLSDDELTELEDRLVAEFDALRENPDVTPETVQRQMQLTEDLDRVRPAQTGRRAAAAEAAERARAALVQESERLQARVHGDPEPPAGGDGPAPPPFDPAQFAESVAKAAAEGATAALVAALGDRGQRFDVARVTDRAHASLSAARQHAPAPDLQKRKLAVTAGVDIPGVARSQDMGSLDDVVDAFQRTAKSMRVTHGNPNETLVASIRREFEHTVDERTPPGQIEELFRHLTRKDKMEALVAGGGWCAPSEIRYEFFNVAASDGLIDLPTFGVSRGGIRFPVSPSLADAVYGTGAQNLPGFGATFSNTSDPWLWTETDDILTVTGSTNKPTMRVPCPGFGEVRLECYGITLTAGNLTDDAYPEATANTLRLLTAAFEHAQNGRIINQMVALSTVVVTGGGFNGGAAFKPAFNQILSGMDLAATDYRAKFGMMEEDVLEVVAPYWLKSVIIADLAWRTNVDLISVTDAQVAGFFSDRALRVQWVNDWQVRGSGNSGFGNPTTPMTAWPTSCQLMIYAAGTFIKGNGLQLDLGVVRDSVLNAENDFTAAWSEECHLIARVGHESRVYTITFAVDGAASPALAALGAQI